MGYLAIQSTDISLGEDMRQVTHVGNTSFIIVRDFNKA